MTTGVRVLCTVLCVACHRTPTPRERALAQLPGAAQVVAAADGEALADPAIRRAIDAARTHVAPSFGCVIDAALAGDAVAVAASRTVGATVVIATTGTPPHCPALSRVSDDLWVATTGDATVARAEEASAFAVSRWSRARGYLADAPISLAIDLGALHAVAAAQPHPLEAWLAVDAPADAAAAFERAARARLAQPAFKKLELAHRGDQIVVTASHLESDDLVALAPALLDALDPPPHPEPAPDVPCPREVLRCIDASHYEVMSIPDFFLFLDVGGKPVVAAGQVIGYRLDADSASFLRRGDIVLGIDGRPVRSAEELRVLGKMPRRQVTLAFRRDGRDRVVQITSLQ